MARLEPRPGVSQELSPGDIAVIAHPDLDNVAAQSLVEAKVKAVINTQASITGRYPNLGPSQLLKHSVPLLDVESEDLLTSLDGRRIRIDCSSGAVVDVETEELLCQGRLQDEELIEKLSQARDNLQEEVERFIDNTLEMPDGKGFCPGSRGDSQAEDRVCRPGRGRGGPGQTTKRIWLQSFLYRRG